LTVSLTPSRNAPLADIVMTPRALAIDIIDHFRPSGSLLDPCAGDGAFYDNYPDGCASAYCEIAEGLDFFNYSDHVDWIVTNPPWSKMRSFLNHAYVCADNIVYLSTMTHFVTKARLREMRTAGFGIVEFYCIETPKVDWPQSGFQLCAAHIQRGHVGPVLINGRVGE
jgi:hypothetical protein